MLIVQLLAAVSATALRVRLLRLRPSAFLAIDAALLLARFRFWPRAQAAMPLATATKVERRDLARRPGSGLGSARQVPQIGRHRRAGGYCAPMPAVKSQIPNVPLKVPVRPPSSSLFTTGVGHAIPLFHFILFRCAAHSVMMRLMTAE